MGAMRGHLLAAAAALLSLQGSEGIKSRRTDWVGGKGDPFNHGNLGGYKKYRQVMTNYGDVQYTVYVDVGHQTLTGILDTGSFELVVFGKNCYTCGNAAKYDPIQSPTHKAGKLYSGQTFGSGDTWSTASYDLVSIGPYKNMNQSFWEVNKAKMPVLYNSMFQCILGFGPPETPAADAWSATQRAVRNISDRLLQHTKPSQEDLKAVSDQLRIANHMSTRTTMLDTFEVGAFSICIGKKPMSDGFFIWNDTSHEEEPDIFTRVPVVGKHTWSVVMKRARLVYGNERLMSGQSNQPEQAQFHKVKREAKIRLFADGFANKESEKGPGVAWSDSVLEDEAGTPGSEDASLGCEEGCSALLDSGTSLIALPKEVINHLVAAMKDQEANCSKMADLPSLAFEMGGTTFVLPPDVYVAEVQGNVPSYMQSFVRVRNLAEQKKQRPGARCELLVMESYAKTSYGPLWVLGLPFFRQYYTTFSIGTGNGTRAIYIARASESCTPTGPYSWHDNTRGTELWKRTVDPSMLWVPLTVQQAAGADFVRL